ncbi:MAG: maleylpyruvate isomerase N-terminal domain-containing protein [Acidimicrobiales bacterium]
MLNHRERVEVARDAIDYLTGRDHAEMQLPVPNCPGWSVYNTAVHVGRVCVAWEQMMRCSPDDTTARDRAYEISGQRPPGADPAELASWAHSAIDFLAGDESRECFFSMTGGHGTTGLWAWHAASEIGVHRLDVESALGHPHAISDRATVDSTTYACQFFLPAMRRVTGQDPGSVTAELLGADGRLLDTVKIESEPAAAVHLRGPAVQMLLALWGRPHVDIEVVDGDSEVLAGWRALPGASFQFGTWN